MYLFLLLHQAFGPHHIHATELLVGEHLVILLHDEDHVWMAAELFRDFIDVQVGVHRAEALKLYSVLLHLEGEVVVAGRAVDGVVSRALLEILLPVAE